MKKRFAAVFTIFTRLVKSNFLNCILIDSKHMRDKLVSYRITPYTIQCLKSCSGHSRNSAGICLPTIMNIY